MATLAKMVTKTLDVGVSNTTIDLSATIKSFDVLDTKFIFGITSNQGLAINLSGATVKYIVEYYVEGKIYAIEGNCLVVDINTISFNLPDQLRGYNGKALIGIYATLTDGTKIDIKDIAVRIEPSIMDKDIDFTAKTYFKDFETVKAEVILAGENAKAQIDQVLPSVQAEIAELQSDLNEIKSDVVSIDNLNTSLKDLELYVGYTKSDVYGVEIDMINKTFKRLAGSIGKNAGADFDNINAFKRRRCNVTDTGVVLAYHGESNYTESGLTTVEITKNNVNYPVNTPVQVMVEQPKFYYKVVPLTVEQIANGKGYHMRKGRYYISDYPKEGFKIHPAFVQNGVVKEKIYLSAYEGSIFDTSASSYLLNDEQVADLSIDKLSSVANVKPCSGLTQNLTRANARLLAHNRGNGWEQQTIQTVSLTQLLFLIEYNAFNMQTAIGMGAVQKIDDGSTNMAENAGGTSSLGNASGAVTNTNGIQIVSYRGEENPFGNIWKFVDGINVMANGVHAVYVADHDFSDKQSAGSYADVGFTLAKTSGYVSAFGYSQDFDWLFLTSETTGNSIVPVGDKFDQDHTATNDGGWRSVRLGGNWFDGSTAGYFDWNVYTSSVTRYRDISVRLVYLGG